MKLYYCPSFHGTNFLNLNEQRLAMNTQVLETQGLLTQLAMHAGLHQEIPSYAERLATYHQALMDYDKAYTDNIFHKSIGIDSLQVAKTLLQWRDDLALCGWNSSCQGVSTRLDTLAAIEEGYEQEASDLALLLRRLEKQLERMAAGEIATPKIYSETTILIPCSEEMLPDHIKPLLTLLKSLVKEIVFDTMHTDDKPKAMEIIRFPQQYQAEAWLSQQKPTDYDVWINADNKRLDNWLHMSGKPVAGSMMLQSNPQIVQLFLLAVQLFQRPLNVNTLLQYLYLPECPLPWKLTSRLASTIVSEGGFSSKKVQEVINGYLANELKSEGDESAVDNTAEERKKLYKHYLPFDLCDNKDSLLLASEADEVDVKKFCSFLKEIANYAGNRAFKIAAVNPNDRRIVQLRQVATLGDALLQLIGNNQKELSFKTLQQWAQSLYETCDFSQYDAQVDCQTVISRPCNMVSKASKAIWCDLYGDVASSLSTDFLSPFEIDKLTSSEHALRLWNREHETAFLNLMLSTPLHMTTDRLTLVVCDRRGVTELPIHPIRLQLGSDMTEVDGQELFNQLPSKAIEKVNNHRDSDAKEVQFDATKHPITWRNSESFSALEKLLQNPLDYFMNYTLGFSDLGPTEIKMSLTRGNVAHTVIEDLFTAHREEMTMKEYIEKHYEEYFQKALVEKGALLLLPEHHLDCDSLRHQLRRCVDQLNEIVEANGLTVVNCEQQETQDLGFGGGVQINGYIDMLLRDSNGNNVVFDLKWSSQKDKFQNMISNNRAMQLAIYQALLQQHKEHPTATRTAFFVLPLGKIISADTFENTHFEHIEPNDQVNLMEQLRIGYQARREEISQGVIETSYMLPLTDIPYANKEGVFPLEAKDQRNPKKVKNPYSDYTCFIQ